MGLLAYLAVIYLIATVALIFYRPEIVIGVQLFSTPLFALAFKTAGIGIGPAYFILSLSALSLAVSYYHDQRSQWLPKSGIEISLLLLLLWAFFTLSFTPSPYYGTIKVQNLAAIAIPCLLIARIYGSTPEKMDRVLITVGWFAIVTVFLMLALTLLDGSGGKRLRSAYFGPLSLAYINVATLPFVMFLIANTNIIGRVLGILSTLASIYMLVGSGSRGGTLAVIVAVVISLMRVKNFFKTLLGLVAIGTLSFMVVTKFAPESGLERLLGNEELGGYNSGDSRLALYASGFDQFQNHPVFGQGIGSFGFHEAQKDFRLYPHNFFIEIAGELGLIGLTIIAVAMFLCFRQIIIMRSSRSEVYRHSFWAIACIQALFLAGLINSCLSFDMPLQRMLFVSLGLLAAVTKWNKGQLGYQPSRKRSYGYNNYGEYNDNYSYYNQQYKADHETAHSLNPSQKNSRPKNTVNSKWFKKGDIYKHRY